MSAPSRKTYRVCFMARSCFRISLRARSEADAVARAKRLWQTKGEEPFTCYCGDDDAWDAELE